MSACIYCGDPVAPRGHAVCADCVMLADEAAARVAALADEAPTDPQAALVARIERMERLVDEIRRKLEEREANR